MACTFPTYSDVTGAQILEIVYPRSAIGRWNETTINADKTALGTMSVIGQAVTYFNSLITQCSIDLDAMSVANCNKLKQALYWYIVGKYREKDLELEGCPECCETDELIKLAFGRACSFVKSVDNCLGTTASFCKYEKTNYGFSGFFGATGYKPCNCD